MRTIMPTYYIYYYYYYCSLYTSPNECVCLCGYLRPLFKHWALRTWPLVNVSGKQGNGYREERKISFPRETISPHYDILLFVKRIFANPEGPIIIICSTRDSNSLSAPNDRRNLTRTRTSVCVRAIRKQHRKRRKSSSDECRRRAPVCRKPQTTTANSNIIILIIITIARANKT